MLTDIEIRRARPRKKPYKLTDGDGLTLIVNPNGAKLWRFRYVYGGREKMIGLGRHPDTSLKLARQKRNDARQALARGVNPSAERKAAKLAQADTFEAVAREWLAAGCPGDRRRNKHVETGTVAQLRHRLETYAFPRLGSWPIADVTAPELLKVLRHIESRGRLETAHRVRSLCSRVFRYAVRTGRAERDPAGDLKGAIAPAKTKNFAAITEPKALGVLLAATANYDGQPATRAALQLLALTFVRPGELRLATWGELDADGDEPQWIIPAARTKLRREHIVPLVPQAVAILAEIRPLTDRGPNSLVFPSLRPGRPLSDNTLNYALRNMGYDGSTHVAHGFRSSASTLLHELGFKPDVIETQLAHARPGVAGVYNRSHLLPRRRKLMRAWADYLDTLKAGAEVVAIGQGQIA